MSFRSQRVLGVCGMALFLACGAWGIRAQDGAPKPRQKVELDPVCKPPRSEIPVFPPGNPSPGTRRMAARLKVLQATDDPAALMFESARLAAILREGVAQQEDPKLRLRLTMQWAMQEMQAGRPDNTINILGDVEDQMRAAGVTVTTAGRRDIRMRRATAYLRLGEQENCLARPVPDSCLFPVPPAARHALRRGSETAVGLLEDALADQPGDLGARWLLNIAQMTLGGYPDKVPPKFLIPPSAFASEYPMPRFPNVAPSLGLDIHDQAGGVIADDFDNDGNLDLVLSSWSLQGQLRFFRNNGDGTFVERTVEAGLVGITGGLNIQQTDYNNDGLLDIWVMRGAWLGKAGRHPRSLLRNNGDGTFTDVTEEAGLLTLHPTQAAAWFDYDGDGWLDLVVGNESMESTDPDWCELFHNNRDGTFTECAASTGLRVAAMVKGVACADYDGDGRPDLYFSVRNGPNLLFRNAGPSAGGTGWRFEDTTAKAGVAEPVMSFPTWFFDYDNDGRPDLFVSGYWLTNGVADIAADVLGMPGGGAKARLYRNNGDGTFSDVTAKARLDRVLHTMGCNFGDLDNDGFLDFYLATGDPLMNTLVPNRMFRNAGDGTFQDVTTASGTGHLQKGHAVAIADLDNDGDEDLFVVMGGAYTGDTARSVLYMNPGNANHWLKVRFTGVKANRAAIGAVVHLVLATPRGERHLYRTIGSGGSFGSNPLRLEAGLGDATAIASAEVRWPGSGLVQKLEGLQPDHAYSVREGEPPAAMPLKAAHFAGTAAVAQPAAAGAGGR